MSHTMLPVSGRLLLATALSGAVALGCSKRESAPQPPAERAAADSAPPSPLDTASMSSTAAPASTPSPTPSSSASATPAPATASAESVKTSPSPMTVTRLRSRHPRLQRDTAQRDTAQPNTAQPAAAPPAAPDSAKASSDDQWVSFDPKTNTVTFKLVAGPFSFNGYTNGRATLTVPPNSNVVVNFIQDDGTPHSAEVASGEGPIPNAGGDPAIPRAYTNKVVEGLPQGAQDVMRFTAPESGSYRIICGVPGHALSGTWIWFKIDPAAKVPKFGKTS